MKKNHPKVCRALTGVTEAIQHLPRELSVATGRDVIDQGLRDCATALKELREHYDDEGATAGKTFELALNAVRTIDTTRDTLQKSKVEPSVVVKVLETLGTALGLVTAIVACAAAPFLVVPGVVAGVAAGAVAVSAVVVGRVGQAWGRHHAEEARTLMRELTRADTDLKKELTPFVDVTTRLISAVTLAKIKERLDETTQSYAGGLFDPRSKTVGGPVRAQGVQGAEAVNKRPASITIADLDGSEVRGVIGAVLSGHARVTERGCELIAVVLTAEAQAAMNDTDGLKQFQQNAVVRDALTELQGNLTFHEGHTELVFVGDACFDRFGVNEAFQFWLQGELSAKGARYILGNHDDTEVTLARRQEKDPSVSESPTFGDYVSRGISLEQWQNHIQRVFQRAYYSPTTHMLTTHQGVTLLGDYILWAGGYLRAEDYRNDPQKLAADINAQKRIPLTKPRREDFTLDQKRAIMTLLKACGGMGHGGRQYLANHNCQYGTIDQLTEYGFLPAEKDLQGAPEADGSAPGWHAPEDFDWHAAAEFAESEAFRTTLLTDFRPSDDDCRRVGALLGCTITHGHDGVADVNKDGVLAMNARSKKAKDFNRYLPLAVEVFLPVPVKAPAGVSWA
ncbi:hypothetical protein [Pandoraea sputorum]|nr:hypothetical protein [Pandoraea sputorum]